MIDDERCDEISHFLESLNGEERLFAIWQSLGMYTRWIQELASKPAALPAERAIVRTKAKEHMEAVAEMQGILATEIW